MTICSPRIAALAGSMAWAIALQAQAQFALDSVASDNYQNTAMGSYALYTVGGNRSASAVGNTAAGFNALYFNTTGNSNTAFGDGAMQGNTTGVSNVAVGMFAMYNANSGSDNSALGYQALQSNWTGGNNSAFGVGALGANSTGNDNAAFGSGALSSATTGSGNVALGYGAGRNLATGSNNIYIGNPGGSSSEDGTIRIGTHGTQTGGVFITSVYAAALTTHSPRALYVNSLGQLGYLPSAERFKTDIASMGEVTDRLEQLRPVMFRLKNDDSGTVQYGLIAEEVAKVYPELVARDENGRIDGVRYEELTPMLLNEVQKQRRENAEDRRQISALKERLSAMEQRLAEVEELKRELAMLQDVVSSARTATSRPDGGAGL